MDCKIHEGKSLLLMVCAIAFVMAMSVGSAGAANMLVNPGFELGTISDSPGQAGLQAGWNYLTDNGYFRSEVVLGPVVDSQAFVFSGTDSETTCCDLMDPGYDVNTFLAQRHAVTANTWYTASAWVYAREMIAGSGLGNGVNDHAGVRILELDANQQLLVDRGLAGIYDVTTGFVQVSQTFQTGATTAYVDYELDTLMSNPDGYWGGRVIYDDCVLEAVPEPSSLLALLCGVSGLGVFARRRR